MQFLTFDSAEIPSAEDGGAKLASWLKGMRDRAPVWVDERTGAHHVFGYAESKAVMYDHAHFSSDWSSIAPPQDDMPEYVNLGTVDPPAHRRLRTLVNQAFPQKEVAALEPRVRQIAERLLDAVADQDEFDLVDTLSNPLPALVVAELLGVPYEDQPMFRKWMEDAFNSFDNPIGDLSDVQVADVVVENLRALQEYMLDQVTQRRKQPRDDLISRLLAAEVDGDRLSDTEAYGMASAILMGGQISSTVTLGTALYTFQEEPRAEAAMRADRSLIPRAVEEVLRYRPPVMLAHRLVKPGATLQDTPIAPGNAVVTWIMSANRDPAQFADPDAFHVDRTPNPHLSWGHGVHYCLGALLGRIEAKVALDLLFTRYGEISCVDPVFHTTPGVLGIKGTSLSVRRA
ncbi:cytochrome P450 [Sphaerisporangium melleum]|uniref:Cytochrome P450 n=1 Tax=Sphaerisporangium melleum TaxID=321316 RepID=A0A917QYU9_9ACTN|nr:cytochrome P450 [Sphaerisporangium melleum]GGK78130.1 cytochrome P450 [Sphaerisporangium melleum]GII71938.1 cytochrome P450 [Sphaerisporangium melleum]